MVFNIFITVQGKLHQERSTASSQEHASLVSLLPTVCRTSQIPQSDLCVLFTMNVPNTNCICVPKPVEYTDICTPSHPLTIFIYLQELAQSRRDVTQLTTEVEQLRREKADLVGEVEAHKSSVRVWSCDCYHKLHNTGRNIVSPATLALKLESLGSQISESCGQLKLARLKSVIMLERPPWT